MTKLREFNKHDIVVLGENLSICLRADGLHIAALVVDELVDEVKNLRERERPTEKPQTFSDVIRECKKIYKNFKSR